MILTQLERTKINWDIPTFTLDVNQIALKPPGTFPPYLYGLLQLEWNYFQESKIELCVTPTSSGEIVKAKELTELGYPAFNRFQKTQLYKLRPSGATLDLTENEANELWMRMRHMLFPTVADGTLTTNQKHDIDQLMFHTVASGTIENTAFVTNDGAFHRAKADISNELGVTILQPGEAWDMYKSSYSLVEPSEEAAQKLWQDQQILFRQIRSTTMGH